MRVSHVKNLHIQYKIYLNTISFNENVIWHSFDSDFFEILFKICKDKQHQNNQIVDNWIKSMNNPIYQLK